jgi:hypothetical protein
MGWEGNGERQYGRTKKGMETMEAEKKTGWVMRGKIVDALGGPHL